MTTIYFVRHAQADNKNRDALMRPLTESGMQNRHLACDYLADKQIDAALSSPFLRAIETIRPLCDKLNLPIRIIEDFRERRSDSNWDRGTDFVALLKRQWANFSYTQSDGEPLNEVQDRNIAALQAVLDEYDGQTFVIGTHGTALSMILNYYDPAFGFEDFWAKFRTLPWLVKMTFDHKRCLDIEQIALPGQDTFIATAITAHSGCEDTPDDSMEAVLRGIELKADAVEIDVRRAHDGTLVLAHDERSDYQGAVTLEAAFAAVSPSRLSINCDLKEAETAQDAIALAQRFGIRPERLIFSGALSPAMIDAHADIRDGATIYINIEQALADLLEDSPSTDLRSPRDAWREVQKQPERAIVKIDELIAICRRDGYILNLPDDELMRPHLERLQSSGIKLSLWTINQADRVDALLRLNVKNITTRKPALVIERRQAIRGER